MADSPISYAGRLIMTAVQETGWLYTVDKGQGVTTTLTSYTNLEVVKWYDRRQCNCKVDISNKLMKFKLKKHVVLIKVRYDTFVASVVYTPFSEP